MASIPELRKIAKSVLLTAGLKYPGQDGRSLYLYKELQKNRYDFVFTLTQVYEEPKISFGCTFVSNQIGNTINFVDGEKHIVFPSNKRCSKEWSEVSINEQNIEDVVQKTIEEAEQFVEHGSFSSQLEFLLSTINVPGSHQLWHIAALASTKQTEKLQALLLALRTPERGGVWPYIKEPLIEKAIDYSIKYA
jgi:hypothetical protein